MFNKKALPCFLGAIVLFSWVSIPFKVRAASTCTPTVSIQETKETSVKLKITCLDLKSTKVAMKIIVSNDDSDSDSKKKAKATLGKKGNVKLKISGLDSATKYSFKVKIKKASASSSAYSAYSSSVDATTEGSDYSPEIEKINGIAENSVKLNISCEDLENKAVNVQVAYKKKTSWSTKTYALTLDDDGEGSITVDGLKSGTSYSFKIKVKKDGDDSYSAYSSVKTATTDDD